MTDEDPKADGLDIAIGWLQKSLDELTDVTRRVRDVSPGISPTSATATKTKPWQSNLSSARPTDRHHPLPPRVSSPRRRRLCSIGSGVT